MATAIKMPQLGVTMTEGKVAAWLKHEGDTVAKGEPVASIETDKLSYDVEASSDGVLRRIVVQEGETVAVTGVMGVIAAPGDSDEAVEVALSGRRVTAAPAAALATAPAAPSPAPTPVGASTSIAATPASSTAAPAASESPSDAGEVRASPIARRLAADLGVDLTRLTGSGPSGRIVEADVRTAAASAAATVMATASAETAVPSASSNGFVLASPLARRLAREHRLDLTAVSGSGPQGRVVERDVLASVEARAKAPVVVTPAVPPAVTAPAAPQPAIASPVSGDLTIRERQRVDGIRRVIANRMHQSLLGMAQLTLTMEADATALAELRGHLVPAAKVYGHRPPTYTDLLVYLVSRVLRNHPWLNGSMVGEGDAQEIVAWKEINVGVAVSLERGLIVPVVKQADQKPLQTISQEVADLAERARTGKVAMDELQGGTFTITNLGRVEVEAFTPIINPPQSAILGVGRIALKPAAYNGQVALRQMVMLSLSFDHRVVDGEPAGAFLRDVKRSIESAALDT